MGNEINQSQIDSTIEDERVIFPGYKSDLESENISNQNKAEIDKEHITINKIFKATLDEDQSDKYTFLEEHVAILLSLNKEPKFRINNLDDIIRYLIKDKSNPLDYLFSTYSRSITMIEIKFRKDYDKSFKQIHRIVANHIGTIITDPSLFGKKISDNEIYNSYKNYLSKCNMDELGFFFYDIHLGIMNNEKALNKIFGFFFKYINEQNDLLFHSFLNGDHKESLSKNMTILKSLFIAFPELIKLYVDLSLKDKIKLGSEFQKKNYICRYINVSPIEDKISNMRNIININRPKREIDLTVESYSNKFNNYLAEVADFLIVMYTKDPFYSILDWVYELIKLNLDKIKLYKNNDILSTNGFLLNIIIILNKIIFKEFEKGIKSEQNYSNFVFKIVGKIDALFTLTDRNIPFSKFDRANPEIVNPIIHDSNDSKDSIPPTFTIYTKLFFTQEIFIHFTMKNFMKQVENFSRDLQNKIDNGGNIKNNVDLQNMIIVEQILMMYLRNKDLHKGLLRFSEVSTFLIFSLNNKKYSQYKFSNNTNEINYKEFLDDFYDYINFDDNFAISLLPQFIYQNLITISQFVKIYNEDSLIEHIYCTKALVYFSLIFSCQTNLIKNPHFRMEIFDIMIFFFSSKDIKDKTRKINQIFKLLKEKFIKDSLMVSILRVFVDAERLGTSNQFYEKFSVRAKILYLIENINKGYGHLFEENIKVYTEKYYEESKKMINNLLNDLIYLNDECIENLKAIKKYQDLLDDKEKYGKMSEENKKFEESKFNEKDRIVKAEIRLFNGSFKFLLSLTKILQNFFIKNQFLTQLTSFLNYSLNIFASPLGNELKLKNLNEYDFDPKFILGAILSIYSSFYDKIEFIESVVKDERSYSFKNFERAKNVVENKAIKIETNDFNNYLLFIEKLKDEEQKIKDEEINYDDAPDEFIDQLTSLIMTDPVELPQSHMILDRKTIETHLLSDQTDPYNRSPLTKEMLIPCPELKARIEEYINKKKQEKKQAIQNK